MGGAGLCRVSLYRASGNGKLKRKAETEKLKTGSDRQKNKRH